MVTNSRLASFHQPAKISLDLTHFTWTPSDSSEGLDPTAHVVATLLREAFSTSFMKNVS